MDRPFVRLEAPNGASPNGRVHAALGTRRILAKQERLVIDPSASRPILGRIVPLLYETCLVIETYNIVALSLTCPLSKPVGMVMIGSQT